MIEQSGAFDEMIVAIGENPDKRYTFSHAERLAMLKTTAHLPHVRVETFKNCFLVNFAREVGANFILRGIREGADYEFERKMRYINADLAPGVDTVFLMPPREIAEVSSTMVKGLVGPDGWKDVVRHYVPEPAFQRLVSWREAA